MARPSTSFEARLKASGLVWRLARRYDSAVVRQISEADVDANLVVVFRVLRRGKTSLVFALTHGDTSSKALKAATHRSSPAEPQPRPLGRRQGAKPGRTRSHHRLG